MTYVSCMKIKGGRSGHEFKVTVEPAHQADAWFIAIGAEEAILTRCLSDILTLPDETPVVANWHGKFRTDAFSTSVGELREKAAEVE